MVAGDPWLVFGKGCFAMLCGGGVLNPIESLGGVSLVFGDASDG
jgi:hypothetical protein